MKYMMEKKENQTDGRPTGVEEDLLAAKAGTLCKIYKCREGRN